MALSLFNYLTGPKPPTATRPEPVQQPLLPSTNSAVKGTGTLTDVVIDVNPKIEEVNATENTASDNSRKISAILYYAQKSTQLLLVLTQATAAYGLNQAANAAEAMGDEENASGLRYFAATMGVGALTTTANVLELKTFSQILQATSAATTVANVAVSQMSGTEKEQQLALVNLTSLFLTQAGLGAIAIGVKSTVKDEGRQDQLLKVIALGGTVLSLSSAVYTVASLREQDLLQVWDTKSPQRTRREIADEFKIIPTGFSPTESSNSKFAFHGDFESISYNTGNSSSVVLVGAQREPVLKLDGITTAGIDGPASINAVAVTSDNDLGLARVVNGKLSFLSCNTGDTECGNVAQPLIGIENVGECEISSSSDGNFVIAWRDTVSNEVKATKVNREGSLIGNITTMGLAVGNLMLEVRDSVISWFSSNKIQVNRLTDTGALFVTPIDGGNTDSFNNAGETMEAVPVGDTTVVMRGLSDGVSERTIYDANGVIIGTQTKVPPSSNFILFRNFAADNGTPNAVYVDAKEGNFTVISSGTQEPFFSGGPGKFAAGGARFNPVSGDVALTIYRGTADDSKGFVKTDTGEFFLGNFLSPTTLGDGYPIGDMIIFPQQGEQSGIEFRVGPFEETTLAPTINGGSDRLALALGLGITLPVTTAALAAIIVISKRSNNTVYNDEVPMQRFEVHSRTLTSQEVQLIKNDSKHITTKCEELDTILPNNILTTMDVLRIMDVLYNLNKHFASYFNTENNDLGDMNNNLDPAAVALRDLEMKTSILANVLGQGDIQNILQDSRKLLVHETEEGFELKPAVQALLHHNPQLETVIMNLVTSSILLLQIRQKQETPICTKIYRKTPTVYQKSGTDMIQAHYVTREAQFKAVFTLFDETAGSFDATKLTESAPTEGATLRLSESPYGQFLQSGDSETIPKFLKNLSELTQGRSIYPNVSWIDVVKPLVDSATAQPQLMVSKKDKLIITRLLDKVDNIIIPSEIATVLKRALRLSGARKNSDEGTELDESALNVLRQKINNIRNFSQMTDTYSAKKTLRKLTESSTTTTVHKTLPFRDDVTRESTGRLIGNEEQERAYHGKKSRYLNIIEPYDILFNGINGNTVLKTTDEKLVLGLVEGPANFVSQKSGRYNNIKEFAQVFKILPENGILMSVGPCFEGHTRKFENILGAFRLFAHDAKLPDHHFYGFTPYNDDGTVNADNLFLQILQQFPNYRRTDFDAAVTDRYNQNLIESFRTSYHTLIKGGVTIRQIKSTQEIISGNLKDIPAKLVYTSKMQISENGAEKWVKIIAKPTIKDHAGIKTEPTINRDGTQTPGILKQEYIDSSYNELMTLLDRGAVIAHCSAGVGRSGAFITLLLGILRNKFASQDAFISLIEEVRTQRHSALQKDTQVLDSLELLIAVLEKIKTTHSNYKEQQEFMNKLNALKGNLKSNIPDSETEVTTVNATETKPHEGEPVTIRTRINDAQNAIYTYGIPTPTEGIDYHPWIINKDGTTVKFTSWSAVQQSDDLLTLDIEATRNAVSCAYPKAENSAANTIGFTQQKQHFLNELDRLDPYLRAANIQENSEPIPLETVDLSFDEAATPLHRGLPQIKRADSSTSA